MKLDILKKSMVDIVFEGRNKTYGAYELRKSNRKTTIKASRSDIFSIALAAL
jgi:protein TonB